MDKQVVLDQIEVSGSGKVGVRFKKQVVDGSQVMLCDYYRITLASTDDLSARYSAMNTALSGQSWPSVSTADWDKIEAQCAAAWG